MLYNPIRHNYHNMSFDYVSSAVIKEYDIKSGGFNMLISAKAIDEKTIEMLNKLPKGKRHIKLGLMQKENRNLSKIMNDEFVKYRRMFIEANNIEDHNIISVKKDAFFLVNAKIKKTKFNNVEFVAKNRYSSYYYIDGNEYYYKAFDDILEIKGFGDEEENEKFFKHHNKYMLKFLREVMKLNEVSHSSACEYLYKFANKYRNRKLNINYYRELNPRDSYFRLSGLSFGGNDLGVDIIDDVNVIDINYNYIHVILPLIKLIY